MTRSTQTAILVIALIVAMAVAFSMFTAGQDANAIARKDPTACWSDSCRSSATAALIGS